ncbi:MAG TPA: kelch repeat-containing protein [Candidatus Kapabacteria bacterium]|jgi:hypothetical protein|nr:kelch repeat-containing protein [Candidatus Kapabacteria bacterium]
MRRTAWLTLLIFTGVAVSETHAQQWQYTGSLSIAKQELTITALDNGMVLATGGMNDDNIPHAECELYNPATQSWTLTDSLKVARILHTAVKLNDGRIAVFGGQIGGTYDGGFPVQTAEVEIYDPTTMKWSDGGELQIAREHQTTSLLPDGRVFVAGGLNGVSPTASCEIYDPATKASTLVASMQLARYEHQATILIDGRVMVSGGRDGGWDGDYFSECEIYDPSTDTWTVIEPMHQARQRALLVQFSDGSILAAAGRNTPSSTAPGSELYDLSTGHWTETDPMKVPCTWLAPVLLPNDRYLATGGFYDATWTSSTQVQCTATAEWYDKPNSRWYFAPDMEQARGRHGAAYIHQTVNDSLPSDFILVAGGIIGDNTYTNTCEILDATQNSMETYKAMTINRASSNVTQNNETSLHAVVIYNDVSPYIEYSLPTAQTVSVHLISISGLIARDYEEGGLQSGIYDLTLSSRTLPSGAYIADIQAGDYHERVKLLIMH